MKSWRARMKRWGLNCVVNLQVNSLEEDEFQLERVFPQVSGFNKSTWAVFTIRVESI